MRCEGTGDKRPCFFEVDFTVSANIQQCIRGPVADILRKERGKGRLLRESPREVILWLEGVNLEIW